MKQKRKDNLFILNNSKSKTWHYIFTLHNSRHENWYNNRHRPI